METSIEELASADAYETEHINIDKRFGLYGVLVKQYCGVIEQELNQIITIDNNGKCPLKHLMWNELRVYIRKNIIELPGAPFKLQDLLKDLHSIRNLAMHGERIT